MSIYEGKRNSMKVMSNRSGNMTFKIPAASTDKRSSLVTLTDEQLEDLRDQIDEHLGAEAVDLTETRAALQTQLDFLRNARGDHSAVISILEDALSELN